MTSHQIIAYSTLKECKIRFPYQFFIFTVDYIDLFIYLAHQYLVLWAKDRAAGPFFPLTLKIEMVNNKK